MSVAPDGSARIATFETTERPSIADVRWLLRSLPEVEPPPGLEERVRCVLWGKPQLAEH